MELQKIVRSFRQDGARLVGSFDLLHLPVCVCVCVCVCVVGYMFLKMFVGGILKSFHVINIHRPHTYDYTCVNNISVAANAS